MVPAFDAVGAISFVNVTLEFAEHVPFVTVHFNVTGVPAATPVTVDAFDVGVVMVTPAQPLVHVHAPVPVAGLPPEFGLLPASVNEPLLHCA